MLENRRFFLKAGAYMVASGILLAAGESGFESLRDQNGNRLPTLFEAEIYDIVKSISYLGPPKDKDSGAYLRTYPIDYSTYPKVMNIYHEFVKNLTEGNLKAADSVTEKLINISGAMDVSLGIKATRANALANFSKAEVLNAKGEYREASFYVKKTLKYVLLGRDFPFLMYVYPDISDILMANGYEASNDLLSDKINAVYRKSYNGSNPKAEERLSRAIKRHTLRNIASQESISIVKRSIFSSIVQDLLKDSLRASLENLGMVSSFYNMLDSVRFLKDSTELSMLRKYGLALIAKDADAIPKALTETNPNHFLSGDYFLYKAKLFLLNKRPSKAVQYGLKAREVYMKAFTKPNPKILDTLNLLVKGYSKLNDPNGMIKHSREIMKALKESPGKFSNKEEITAMTTMSESFFLNKDYENAIRYMRMAIKKAKKYYGVSSDEVKILQKSLDFLQSEADASNPF